MAIIVGFIFGFLILVFIVFEGIDCYFYIVLFFFFFIVVGLMMMIYKEINSIEKDCFIVLILFFLIIIVFWGVFE